MKKYRTILLCILFALVVGISGCRSGEKTVPLENASAANAANGGYLCETEEYIFYRNSYDSGKLCRYDKDSGEIKVLFDKNRSPFLHSIRVVDGMLYFVTCAENDETPVLYRTDLEGGAVTKVIDNVGDCYLVDDEGLYYTSYRESNDDIFHLYRYTYADGNRTLLADREIWSLVRIENTLYFIDSTFEGTSLTSGSGIVRSFNIQTGEFASVSTARFPQSLCVIENTLFIQCLSETDNTEQLRCYDPKSGKEEIVFTSPDNRAFSSIAILGTNDIFCLDYYYDENQNIIAELLYWDGRQFSEYNGFPVQTETTGRLHIVEGMPVIADVSNMPEQGFYGCDKLNVEIR